MTPIDQMIALAAKENAAMRRRYRMGPPAVAPTEYPAEFRPCPLVAKRRKRVLEMQNKGMSLTEISDLLGITLSTAKSDAAKAKKHD